jgi:hypothetical protein
MCIGCDGIIEATTVGWERGTCVCARVCSLCVFYIEDGRVPKREGERETGNNWWTNRRKQKKQKQTKQETTNQRNTCIPQNRLSHPTCSHLCLSTRGGLTRPSPQSPP